MTKVYKMDTSYNITIQPLPPYRLANGVLIDQVKWFVRDNSDKQLSTGILDGEDESLDGILVSLDGLLALAKERAEAYVDVLSQHTLKYVYPEPTPAVDQIAVAEAKAKTVSRNTLLHALVRVLKDSAVPRQGAGQLTRDLGKSLGLGIDETHAVYDEVYGP